MKFLVSGLIERPLRTSPLRLAFDTYSGYWEVSEIATNTPAIAFWRKVIGDYTDGQFDEIARKGRDTDIVIQRFDSSQ